jgi:enamine deaminase RidA (YjgF/YER057c/UK114 family)
VTHKQNIRKARSANPSCVVRSHQGPLAKELFILCRPDTAEKGLSNQTISLYRTLFGVLQQEGGSVKNALQEMVFFRDIHGDLRPFQSMRRHTVSAQSGNTYYAPVATFIQQPPVNGDQKIELLAYAVIPQSGSLETRPIAALPLEQNGLAYWIGGCKHVLLANICGLPGSSEDEAYRMFQAAEKSLQEERMSFRDVIRTWIHFRNIDEDYSALNRGRTRFFRERGLALMPASTGIGGNPPSSSQSMCLSLYAIEESAREAQCMFASTLNEAWMYGSDFSRGIKIAGENGVTLCISGTASIDEEGRTVHEGDFEAQAERMLLNISTLLANQNSSWQDVVSAITYLKDPLDVLRLSRIFEEKGIPGFPNAIVQASVCRPELLCEMEAIAILDSR